MEYDVIVIGGGPAGASSAYHCSKLGLKTILLEKQVQSRDKPCGGALSDRCLPLLGENARNAINCRIEELRVYSPDLKSFRFVKNQGSFVLRRVFDQALVRDAQNAGTDIRYETKAISIILTLGGMYTVDVISAGQKEQAVTGRFVILACGLQDNRLIKHIKDKNGNYLQAICPQNEKDYLAICMNSESEIDNNLLNDSESGFTPKTLGIFFGAVPNGYGWCFTKDGYINIGVGCTASLLNQVKIKNAYDSFLNTLRVAHIIPQGLVLNSPRVYPLPFKHTARETVFGNILLVGDAAGFVSPVTGEGIYYSIKSGQLAAESIFNNIKHNLSLSLYQQKWKKAFGYDLNFWGFNLRNTIYKTKERMEFAVRLACIDLSARKRVSEMIMGKRNYKKTILSSLLILPQCILKFFYKK